MNDSTIYATPFNESEGAFQDFREFSENRGCMHFRRWKVWHINPNRDILL
jgi:hypothetical protein